LLYTVLQDVQYAEILKFKSHTSQIRYEKLDITAQFDQ